MAQPPAYNRYTNFTNFQAEHPTAPLPAISVDEEYNRIKLVTDAIRANLALIQRDDTAVANKSVGYDQLKDEVDLGFNAPTDWVTAHQYVTRDIVFNGPKMYRCTISHISGVFATDLADGNWELLVDFTSATSDAIAAAAAAAASATNADNSATVARDYRDQASASAAAASTSASNAATSASAASTSATNAASSASTASTQATNASNSASAAATSASNAAASSTSAGTSAGQAASSQSQAANSATSASNSASSASTSASNASSSASSASTSATNASNSASAAATSASNAATSATNAANSATQANNVVTSGTIGAVRHDVVQSLADANKQQALDNIYSTAVYTKDSMTRIANASDVTKIVKFDASGITTGTTRTLTVPNKNGTIACLSDISASGVFADNVFRVQDNGDATKQLAFECSGITTATTRTMTIPNFDGTLATLAGTETYTNKTLTSPTINGAALSGTITGAPTLSGNLTLSGTPTIYANALIVDTTDTTKKVKFDASGITTGTTRTLTVPNFDGTIATLAGTETYTNKTLTSPTINGAALSGTFSGTPTFSGALTMSGSPIIYDNATYYNAASTTKRFQFSGASITAGQTRVITLPDFNATMASLAGTETFTNKTLTSPSISSPTITGTVSGAAVATQANMEAEATGVIVTPSFQKYHPSAAKVWVKADTNGATFATYGVTSVTDLGVGDCRVNFSTSFSSAHYGALAMAGTGSNLSTVIAAVNAGNAEILTWNTSSALTDPTYFFFAAFGDQ